MALRIEAGLAGRPQVSRAGGQPACRGPFAGTAAASLLTPAGRAVRRAIAGALAVPETPPALSAAEGAGQPREVRGAALACAASCRRAAALPRLPNALRSLALTGGGRAI